MSTDRREFLKGTAWMGFAAMAAGCQFDRIWNTAGAPMAGFRAEPLKRIRLAFVGVGDRGSTAFRRLCQFPGVDVVAFCDIEERRMKACRETLKKHNLPPAKEFFGPEAYKDLAQWDGADVVYACTPWKLHAPVALAAMNGGKHALVEVPATMDIDSCWELVETSERTRRHCMMLENCCYGEEEMLALNMCRLGVLGEPVYGEAAYLHASDNTGKLSEFRYKWYQEHAGNYYPTHGLGPVCQYMNINRGDCFDYLVSVEGRSVAELAKKGDPRWNNQNRAIFEKYATGVYNSSIIKTMNGNTIFLNLSCAVPHPYSRMNTIQGTKGILMGYPLRIDITKKDGGDPGKFNEETTKAYAEQYKHPVWKDEKIRALAKKVNGHGGMDFIMDLRWVYCLQNGLPLDMDVYDLASWSCLCEVSEKSCTNRGRPEDIPDFTRGAWKTMQPLGIETIDIKAMGFKDIGDVGAQQSV